MGTQDAREAKGYLGGDLRVTGKPGASGEISERQRSQEASMGAQDAREAEGHLGGDVRTPEKPRGI